MTNVTKADIIDGLHRLGVQEGNVILVHSSLKRFGRVKGGVDTVIDALLETVGPNGTVMVPTITGSPDYNRENPPAFDVRNTPCWTGKIPETFRHRPEAIRSLHPTHSVAAIGKQAEYLTRDHHNCATPCGRNSPYIRIGELGGKVVFLGVTLDCCTMLHGVEELAKSPYHLQSEPVQARIIDEKGRKITRELFIHQYGADRQFTVLEPIFLRENIIKIGQIGDAEIRILNVNTAIKRSLELLGNNPDFLTA